MTSNIRIIIPIKKFILSEEQLEKPIPTLSDRQFVVQKSKLSAQDAQIQRELFWYREHLFAAVRGFWREVRYKNALSVSFFYLWLDGRHSLWGVVLEATANDVAHVRNHSNG